MSRRSCAVVAVAMLATTLATVPPAGAEPTPPPYYAVALENLFGINSIVAVNESGVMAGVYQTNVGRPYRVTADSVEELTGVAMSSGHPSAINAAGTIIGNYTPPSGDNRGFVATGSAIVPLATLGGPWGQAADISDAGTVVGTAGTAGGETHAYSYDGATMTDLGTLGGTYSYAHEVNEAGTIAGVARDADEEMHAVTWDAGVITDLGTLGFGMNVVDLNEAGQVAGSGAIAPSQERGFLWDGSQLHTIDTFGGDTAYASALNEAGQVVGQADDASGTVRPFLWEGGVMTDLGDLGGNDAWAADINVSGAIVGTSQLALGTRTHGFVVSDGVMYDVNDLLPAGSVEVTAATSVTDSGFITGTARGGGAVLLVPGERPQAEYDVIDLGTVGPGWRDVSVQDLNGAGQVTGSVGGTAYFYDGAAMTAVAGEFSEASGVALNERGIVVGSDSSSGYQRAFRWGAGVYEDLGTLGGAESYARDVNDAGDVVGSAQVASGAHHAFLRRGAAMIDLHTLGGQSSVATDVNDAGTVIGNYNLGGASYRGFVSDGTTTTDLGGLGGAFTGPHDINASGDIVGTSSTATAQNVAFLYTDGGMQDISPPGSTLSEGIAISDTGYVAGSYVPTGSPNQRRSFLLSGGNHTLIPGLGGNFATAMDVDDDGTVVGYAATGRSSTHAYMFDGSGTRDLNHVVPAGTPAVIAVAHEINGSGVILARGDVDLEEHGLLLIPTAPDRVRITRIRPLGPDPVPRYGTFEAEIELDRTHTNPFDPDEIAIDVSFEAPSGEVLTVPAFWYEGFTAGIANWGGEEYQPEPGSAGWRVRFAPTEVGAYSYSVTATDATGTRTSVARAFTSSASGSPGFVRIDGADPRAMRFDDGTPYLPFGHNAGWDEAHGGTAYYDRLFDSFGRAGENWSRIWMTDFARSALEWDPQHWSGFYDGLGRYSLESAWRMDRYLDAAARNGVMIQLVVNDHGQFDARGSRWSENPYNEANGGPVPSDRPDMFFSDPQARDLFEQRLRYIVARWGSSPNVLAWELFNEVQFIGSDEHNPYNDPQLWGEVIDWHADMAAYLGSIDAYDHLVTSSSDPSPLGPDVASVAGIDLVQIHDYRQPTVDRGQMFVDLITQLRSSHGKPVIVGEFGIGSNGAPPEAGFDPQACTQAPADCEHLWQGTHLHNGVWTAALTGSSAMSWWWDNYIDEDPAQHRVAPEFPLNERVFPPLVAFFAGEDPAADGLVPAAVTASPDVFAAGLDNGSRALVWVRDAQNEYGTGSRPGDLAGRTIAGATLALDDLPPGAYDVEVFDPYDAQSSPATFSFCSGPGAPVMTVPDFTRDVALKVEPSAMADADCDSIADAVDDPNAPNAFLDPTTVPATEGEITFVPAGFTFRVEDAPNPDGVRVVVEGTGNEKVTLRVCGITMRLRAGSDVLLSCASLIAEVVAGDAEIVLGDGLAVITVPSGASAEVTETSGGGFEVSNVTGGDVTVTVDGVTTTVNPGDPPLTGGAWNFEGFASPVDAPPVQNVTKPGGIVPFRFRLTDAFGAPVPIASVDVATEVRACGGPTDAIEEYSKKASGLVSLGSGDYRFDWQSPKNARGTCLTVTLYVGDGVGHEAHFRFK